MPIVLRCGRKSSKCISSFPRGCVIKDRQKELHDLERERQTNLSHILFRNGLREALLFRFPTSPFRATGLSCASPTTALGMCYDNWKWWAARARSGMNRSQGAWHVRVGERDFCWESCSLKIQPSSELPSGIHMKNCLYRFQLMCRMKETSSYD